MFITHCISKVIHALTVYLSSLFYALTVYQSAGKLYTPKVSEPLIYIPIVLIL